MAASKVMIDSVGERVVRIEGTASTVSAFGDANPVGAMLWRSLEELDVEVLPLAEDVATYWGIELHGDPRTVQQKLPDLEARLDDIAQAVDPERSIRSGAANLMQWGVSTLKNSHPDASFMLQMGLLSSGATAEGVSDDELIYTFYGRSGKDYSDNVAAKHADGSRMGNLCARDIGGAVIGWDGTVFAPHQMRKPNILLDLQSAAAIERYASEQDKPLAWGAGMAIRGFLESAEHDLPEIGFDKSKPHIKVGIELTPMALEQLVHHPRKEEFEELEDLTRSVLVSFAEQ